MEINSRLVIWVEYCLCEAIMDIYPKLKHQIKYTDSLVGFCKRMKQSISNARLYPNPFNSYEDRVLRYMMFRAKREYRIPDDKLAEICANFFLDEKWDKYIKVIKLMEDVNYQL